MKKFLAIGAVFAASAAIAVAAPNLTGKWAIHQSIAGNESDLECSLILADNQLAGSCKNSDGKDLPVKGTLEGNKAVWQFDSEYNGTPITLKYTTTLDDSGKMSGTVDVDPFGVSGDFTAAPSKAESK